MQCDARHGASALAIQCASLKADPRVDCGLFHTKVVLHLPVAPVFCALASHGPKACRRSFLIFGYSNPDTLPSVLLDLRRDLQGDRHLQVHLQLRAHLELELERHHRSHTTLLHLLPPATKLNPYF